MTAPEREGDPCPQCGKPLLEDSFVSTYGRRDSETWTIDLVCQGTAGCGFSQRIHESTRALTEADWA